MEGSGRLQRNVVRRRGRELLEPAEEVGKRKQHVLRDHHRVDNRDLVTEARLARPMASDTSPAEAGSAGRSEEPAPHYALVRSLRGDRCTVGKNPKAVGSKS